MFCRWKQEILSRFTILCKLVFSSKSTIDSEKLKKLVLASLSEACVQTETEYEIVRPTTTERVTEIKATEAIKWAEGQSNTPQNQSDEPLASEVACTKPGGAILIAEETSCSPLKKRQRIYNEECIIMCGARQNFQVL